MEGYRDDESNFDEEDFDARYLFPEPSIRRMGRQELLLLIDSNYADATDMVDGTDAHADVRIDVAQDFIEQARDQLERIGHIFTESERSRLRFLRWPPSPEEVERERLAEERRWAAKKAAQVVWEPFMHECMRRLLVGQPLLRGFHAERLELVVGTQPPSYPGKKRLSGQQVLDLAGRYEQLTGLKPGLGYVCSAPGMEFATDPAAGWSLYIPLSSRRDALELILDALRVDEWMSTSLYDMHPDTPLPGWWVDPGEMLRAAAGAKRPGPVF